TEKTLSYYVSQIHYNYWLNLSIPIILIAHLPTTDETYWIEINEKIFKKNKKKWKLEIPLNQKFNLKSKERINRIFSSENDKNFNIFISKSTDNEFDLIENIQLIDDAGKSIINISNLINEQTATTSKLTEKITIYINEGLTNKDARVIAAVKNFGNALNLSSRRVEYEIQIFSELYSEGIFALESLILHNRNNNISMKSLYSDFTALYTLPQLIENALNSYTNLRKTVVSISFDNPVFKEAKNQYAQVIDLLIFEFKEAKILTENLIENHFNY
ncbi:DUF4365 domain-containing protein, partial [Flavobacterium zepuense]